MNRRGGWWSSALFALSVVGCMSRSELDPSGGEAGEGSGAESGSGGGGAQAGSGGGGGKVAMGSEGPAQGGSVGDVGMGSGGPAHGGNGGKVGMGSGGPAHGGSGGKVGGGGPPHGGEGGSCQPARVCGGDITGAWTVASACLDVSGVANVSLLGLGCNSVPVTGSRAVAGTFTANADGTFVDETTTSGEDRFALPDACLHISGVVVSCDRIGAVFQAYGYDTVSCATASDGVCVCDAVFAQASGLGLLSWDPLQSGSFTTSRRTLTLDNGFTEPTKYRYCVSDEQLELLPIEPLVGTLSGAVVLGRP